MSTFFTHTSFLIFTFNEKNLLRWLSSQNRIYSRLNWILRVKGTIVSVKATHWLKPVSKELLMLSKHNVSPLQWNLKITLDDAFKARLVRSLNLADSLFPTSKKFKINDFYHALNSVILFTSNTVKTLLSNHFISTLDKLIQSADIPAQFLFFWTQFYFIFELNILMFKYIYLLYFDI